MGTRGRLSSAVEQRFCKPKVGGSIPSAGTSHSQDSASLSCPTRPHSAPDDIRDGRQYLMEIDKLGSLGKTTQTTDFFSMSACRDLLFHVQEHRMTLTGIEQFLREQDLAFLGFIVESSVLRAYKLRFPNDPAAIDLRQWQIFENENPEIFFGMYQFWIQKRS